MVAYMQSDIWNVGVPSSVDRLLCSFRICALISILDLLLTCMVDVSINESREKKETAGSRLLVLHLFFFNFILVWSYWWPGLISVSLCSSKTCCNLIILTILISRDRVGSPLIELIFLPNYYLFLSKLYSQVALI